MATLEQLAIYLPHDIKCFKEGWKQPLIIKIDRENYLEIGKIHFSNFLEIDASVVAHPLSDLIKSIKVEGYNDGKEFIPLIELAKQTEPDWKWLIEDDHAFCNLNSDDYYEFWYDLGLQVFRFELIIADSDSIIKYPNSQSDLFNLLARWHFWLYDQGDFKTGKIIDINTL